MPDKYFHAYSGYSGTDVEFNTAGLVVAGGRYCDPPFDPDELPDTSTPGNFGAATFDYTVAGQIPEPASLVIWSLLGGLAICLRWRRAAG